MLMNLDQFRHIKNLRARINKIMEGEDDFQLLKHDRKTTVGIIRGSALGISHDVMVKRFVYQGIAKRLHKMISGSRAKRLDVISRMLAEKKLPIPRPMGHIEPSPFNGNAFFLSEVIENAQDLGSLYVSGMFSPAELIAQELGTELARWHMSGAVHSDLKWSNILMKGTDAGVRFFFIDLDRSRLEDKPSINGIVRDLVRFYRYAIELGAEEWVRGSFWPCYISAMGEDLRPLLNADAIGKKARMKWERKGKRLLPVRRK